MPTAHVTAKTVTKRSRRRRPSTSQARMSDDRGDKSSTSKKADEVVVEHPTTGECREKWGSFTGPLQELRRHMNQEAPSATDTAGDQSLEVRTGSWLQLLVSWPEPDAFGRWVRWRHAHRCGPCR
jgi:hypothetical protein